MALSMSNKYHAELSRCLRAGLSESAAKACAEYVERERMCKGPNKVFVPRWRCKFYGARQS